MIWRATGGRNDRGRPKWAGPGVKVNRSGSRVGDDRNAATTRAGRIPAGVAHLDVVVVGATAVDRRVGRRIDRQEAGDVRRGNRHPVHVEDLHTVQGRTRFVVVVGRP